MKLTRLMIAAVLSALTFTACSDDPETPRSEKEKVENVGNGGDIAGFYVLNEGNMGANKCTLDYFDYATKNYIRNIYAERNPNMPMELGDSGNDIAINGKRLYLVVSGSNKVEVLDAETAKRVGQIDVTSPRSIVFDGDYAYVSSFAGGTDGHGTVKKIDLNTLAVTASCEVGYGPEEMVVAGGKLYVANSAASVNSDWHYDNKISVINLSTFTESGSIQAGTNIRRLRIDPLGNIWAAAQGNYYDIAASLSLLKKNNGEYTVAETYDKSLSSMTFGSNTMYYYTVEYDASYNAIGAYFKNAIDASGLSGVSSDFITDGTASSIETPYCITVQPSDGTILITDVKNYVSSGEIRCYNPAGKLQWKARTGDIPGHIAFLKK